LQFFSKIAKRPVRGRLEPIPGQQGDHPKAKRCDIDPSTNDDEAPSAEKTDKSRPVYAIVFLQPQIRPIGIRPPVHLSSPFRSWDKSFAWTIASMSGSPSDTFSTWSPESVRVWME
jgi:hypothetical protein